MWAPYWKQTMLCLNVDPYLATEAKSSGFGVSCPVRNTNVVAYSSFDLGQVVQPLCAELSHLPHRVAVGIKVVSKGWARRLAHRSHSVSHCGAWWLSRLGIWLLVSARVMISWLVRSSSTSGSVLTAHSLLGILSLSLFLCPSLTYTALSQQ